MLVTSSPLIRNGLMFPLKGSLASLILPLRRLSWKPSLQKFRKLPQPPGNIIGTVNDAYISPTPNYFEGGYHWTYERAITICMVPLALTPFVAGVDHPMVDSIFSVLLLFHCHAGFKSCIIDYVPKRVYGFWYGFATKLLTFGTFISIYGVYVLETSSNGLFSLIQGIFSS
ncbi:uncharacterized protein PRCAT00005606001 [Priceomyces carsonii]|uniref:uncharacterized protein n=1 Tax=Priceomyces carsonii TaxID=28549 RepID=UPI002EDADB2E|nr:unnamed protein product [Priceomyces carsonii]